ncbi:MAG: right-handed parallel beta-helix repeat-containing protein [Planctomycetota bacterium]
MKRWSMTTAAWLVLVVAAQAQSVWYVDVDADGANDGTSWEDAFNDLQDAIGAASAGDEIWVAAGLYKPDRGTGDREASFILNKGVALYGGFAGWEDELEERDWRLNETILSGDLAGDDSPGFANRDDNSLHVVRTPESDSDDIIPGRLDGFTVTAGSGADKGGGVYCFDMGATLVNCTIEENDAQSGGGVYSYLCDPTITDCAIVKNVATYDGGGIYLRFSNPAISGCVIHGNSASYGEPGPYRGGGIGCYASSPVIRDCAITVNSATWWGGGLSAENGSHPTVTACTIAFNRCDYFGGGIACDFSPSTIASSVITENWAGYYGGGVTCFESDTALANCQINSNVADSAGGGLHAIMRSNLSLINCTIADNSAGGSGGGIYCTGLNTSADLANGVLWGNRPQQIREQSGATVTVTYSDIEGGWPGEGNIDVDPLFLAPPSGDYHLTAPSPCRGAGDPAAPGLPADDFEGDERTPDGLVDMGADEFHVHLYFTGTPLPGAPIDIRVIGEPGARVFLALGSGELEDPVDTPYGELFLEFPLLLVLNLGTVPASGALIFPVVVPWASPPGYRYPFQALVGLELSNLMVVEVVR